MKRIKECEDEIKEIKDNKEEIVINNNNMNKVNKKENDETDNILENEKKGNKRNIKKENNKKGLKEIVCEKIKKRNLNICSKCLGYNHTYENCTFKDSEPCKKCGFFHIGCGCFRDNKGLIIFYKYKKHYTKVAEIIKKRGRNNIFIKNFKLEKYIRRRIWDKRNLFLGKKNKKEDNEDEKKVNKDF